MSQEESVFSQAMKMMGGQGTTGVPSADKDPDGFSGTIIEIQAREDGGHGLQSQSHRTECWLEGWVGVPNRLTKKVWDNSGYCNLVIKDGKLDDIIPIENPAAARQELENQINALKQELSDTDYKVIKNNEAIAAGFEPPYNPEELHSEREAIRQQIRELEEQL